MRKELNAEALESVAGGKYSVNKNTKCIYFQNISGEYKLKSGKNINDAITLMESFIGVYPTELEYDQACLDALRDQGYVD